MQVTWHDVGRPEEPGTYPFKDGTIRIRPDEIAIWRKHPDARFTVTVIRTLTEIRYGLANYELPDDPIA